ncbi:MAG: mechanosensitive ion channel [Phycisphaerae bacterium]|nr:mechanosensitive ion channel [Phycisphaerae bacterium]MDD5381910.1 mechanosensitive ion channel [Phycisphaerae bacterium]
MNELQINDWALWFLGILVLAGIIGHFLIYRILLALVKHTKSVIDDLCIKHCYRPLQWLVILFIIRLALPAGLPEKYLSNAKQILSFFFIGLVSLLSIKTVYILNEYVLSRFNISVKDNLRARKINTQLTVLKRIVIIIVCILALGTMLMTFEKVRQLGTTILASAGIIGIVIGIAAQRTIGTFIAGLQIAFTQPIRIDDVVIVENEWGRIEEITLTYVVVKIWDMRRLIVPINYFIEKPFQNWTRVTADLLGTVYIYVDYTVPVEAVRAELQKILKDSQLWDGKVCVLQATNTSEHTLELRALMSAPDASTAWSLRCHVREKIVEFIQKNYPESLPKLRASLQQPPQNM